MASDAENGFEVVDKRKRNKSRDSEAVEPEQASQIGEEKAGESTQGEERIAETQSTTGDVYSLMQWFIVMLAEAAWQWMGLHMNPVTKKVEKDMAQAKAAIDSVVFLCDQVAPHVSEEQRAANRSMITDLRMNFVQQQSKHE